MQKKPIYYCEQNELGLVGWAGTRSVKVSSFSTSPRAWDHLL